MEHCPLKRVTPPFQPSVSKPKRRRVAERTTHKNSIPDPHEGCGNTAYSTQPTNRTLKRISATLLLLCLAIAACGKKADEPKNAGDTATMKEPATGTTTSTTTGSGKGDLSVKSGMIEMNMEAMGQSMKMVMYWDDNGARKAGEMNATMAGQAINMKMVEKDGVQYSYNAAQKNGTKSPAKGGFIGNEAPDFTKLSDEEKKAINLQEIAGMELLGKECKGYSFTKDGVSAKVWMWENIPLLLESNANGMTIKMTATKLETDITVPAEKFDIPSDVTFTEIGAPTTAAPGAPGAPSAPNTPAPATAPAPPAQTK